MTRAMHGDDGIGLPAPLSPPDCDLRDFRQMFLDVGRLFGSTFNAKASRNPLAWMLGHKLWYRSWHQLPAGSLPDDDDELCYLAELGFDRATWDSARALAMHGWIKCSDGRLYHPVIAEKAAEAWRGKLQQRHRTFCAAIRKHNERHKDQRKLETPSFEEWDAAGRPGAVTRDDECLSRVTAGSLSRDDHAKNTSKGKGKGKGEGDSSLPLPERDFSYVGSTRASEREPGGEA
nr:hypothetical protein [uncultured Sphingomonas sp.]